MKNVSNEWISVNDMLPHAGGTYLVTYKAKYIKCNFVKESEYYNGKFDVSNVIAWQQMPLPYIE